MSVGFQILLVVFGFAAMLAALFHKAHVLLKVNANHHVICVLKVARLELQVCLRNNKVNQWEAAWIKPFSCFVDSGIHFLQKCKEQGVNDVDELNDSILMKEEIAFDPLPVRSPFPDSFLSIQNHINEAIAYANRWNNPFSVYARSYVEASEELRDRRTIFREFLVMKGTGISARREG
jgi:hypothetical protein